MFDKQQSCDWCLYAAALTDFFFDRGLKTDAFEMVNFAAYKFKC